MINNLPQSTTMERIIVYCINRSISNSITFKRIRTRNEIELLPIKRSQRPSVCNSLTSLSNIITRTWSAPSRGYTPNSHSALTPTIEKNRESIVELFISVKRIAAEEKTGVSNRTVDTLLLLKSAKRDDDSPEKEIQKMILKLLLFFKNN